MYDFPTSSTKRLPNIVSPSKKSTTSTNGQTIQMVTMWGNRPVDDVGKPYIIHVILSAAKDLTRRTPRSFAALGACPDNSEGMTCRRQLAVAHGKASIAMIT